MIIKKEFREERDDVFGFYEIENTLNEEKTEIIQVETLIKETTIFKLTEELVNITRNYDQILAAKTKIETMIQMINEYQEPEI